ncbi:outer membrane protein OmpA-like peptidoglycan-associated protein [Cricetibacter osteomyelitidis]|uniref:Outer membrane protein OmpA-like peptidoglycan-associated protein n=1 Tax=Cricetibacter osteomyelitidis TaxID=1521931 RepID=A0A4R2SJX5_9PAST|nr:OmpA family protein [Cricetibacter osteomyelitidis]TCP90149.1 outer membrane protein OmpA-like peptidoglycan-associated protein [Cricetibacter osteomyelitidis]
MKKTLLGLSMVLALTGCARDANQPLEVWNNFEKSSVSAQLGDNQALVVFYRQDDIAGQAANIYVDGNYQASLLPNAFSPIAVCADKHLFSVSFSSANQFGNRTQGVNYTLPVGEVNYVKVSQVNGKLSFERVESAVGSAAVSKLPKENQTLSRVPAPTNCGTAVMAVENLEAGALFGFNKSGYNDILPNGKAQIQAFADKAKAMPNISKITVSGHTDPVGSAAYNQALSQKRANTVKLALEKAGVTAPIVAMGYGKAEPIVTTCDAYQGTQRNQCNQPNRRVEIAVYGN